MLDLDVFTRIVSLTQKVVALTLPQMDLVGLMLPYHPYPVEQYDGE